MLVAHSYAGAVISKSGHSAKAKGLVYITAYAPDKVETVGALRMKYPSHSSAPILKHYEIGFVWMNTEGILNAFAHHVKN